MRTTCFLRPQPITGSVISIESGTIRYADISPPRIDISRYAPEIFFLLIEDFLMHFVMLCN